MKLAAAARTQTLRYRVARPRHCLSRQKPVDHVAALVTDRVVCGRLAAAGTASFPLVAGLQDQGLDLTGPQGLSDRAKRACAVAEEWVEPGMGFAERPADTKFGQETQHHW